jgi:hypothetical protein
MSYAGLRAAAFIGKDHLTQLSFHYDIILTGVNLCSLSFHYDVIVSITLSVWVIHVFQYQE